MKISKMHYGANAFIFNHAQELRRNMTPSEEILCVLLRDKTEFPWKIRNQHPANKFILDFYCHRAKLAIAFDGEYHLNKATQFYDEDRDRIMEKFGVKTIRFTNSEVKNQLNRVLSNIQLSII